MSIDYAQKIPNNVNLSEDRALQRALEHWQPNYIEWWREMGPDGSQDFDVYLRTAVSVDPAFSDRAIDIAAGERKQVLIPISAARVGDDVVTASLTLPDIR